MSMKLLKPLVAFVLAGAFVPVAMAEELPLSGAAYRIAEQAYASYARGDYAQAAAQAREAVRLRPDVQRLRDLLAQAQARATGSGVGASRPSGQGRPNAARPVPATRVPSSTATTGQTPFEKGYPLATEAYASYYRGEMALAEQQAEQAYRIDPSQGTWAMLWVDSLEAQGKADAALQALQAAVDLGAKNITDLEARKLRIKRAQAVAPAQAGYKAMMEFRPADAVEPARGQPSPVADDRLDAQRPA